MAASLADAQDGPPTATTTETRGIIVGTAFDAANGSPIRQVRVDIDGASGLGAATDTDGKFRLPILAGTYKLRFSAEKYIETVVDQVIVKAGETTEASTVLVQKGAVTTIDVVEKVGAVTATAEAMLSERKLAPVVSDALSAEELRGGNASDAAGALEKVTGVSVVDNGFVYVRGLGERYSATMLNNALLPTTEPERRVVPLDLFPASLIDNIRVLKTYSADLPGEFSGGLVQMQTIDFPAQKTLSVGVSYGFNTVTSFNRFNSFPGGGRDWAGFDDGTRALPSAIPQNQRLFVGNFSDQQFQQFGRAFRPEYEFTPVGSMRPTQTYTVVGGNTFGRLGVVGALTFTNSPQRYPELRRFLVNAGGGRPEIFSDYPQFDVDTESARLGGVLNFAFRVSNANKLVFRNTLTRDSEKEARFFSGINGGNNNLIDDYRLRWIERGLVSTGVEGEHSLAPLGDTLVRWQFTYSKSTRDEPDMREVIYGRTEPGAPSFFLNLPESGLRFFSGLNDRIFEPLAEVQKPFYRGPVSGMFKVGVRATVRRRDFESRRFRFFPVRAQTLDFTQPPNQLFSPVNIRPDGFVLREITRATDSYDALTDIYGGFAMVDLNLGSKWRIIGGLRIEDANIRVTTIDPLVPAGVPQIASLVNRDPLPAVNLIYAITPSQNLRFGYGRTVNRPDFRELSPFEFTNVVGGFSTVGNPDLQRATIQNYDVRWEWFMRGNQVVAVSYFRKDFTDPIEQVYRPTASELRQSFINVAGARNQGFEFEMRKNLKFLGRHAAPFNLQTNFTLVDSEVLIPVDRFPQLTSRERALVGQSRYIYNVITEWVQPKYRSNARLYMNYVSRRITDVGTFNLPDVYQEANRFVDFVYNVNLTETGKWNLRFSADNLTDNRYRFTQSDILVRDFRIGRTFGVGLSYSIF